MKKSQVIVEEVSLKELNIDSNPRKDLGIEGLDTKLVKDIEKNGLISPIIVMRKGRGYEVLDGARRVTCAKLLGWSEILCVIHPETKDGKKSIMRYSVQNNRRNWRPAERAGETKRIKELMNFRTNKELADALTISPAQVSQSMELQKKRETYQTLMDEYNLTESYQVEFVRMEPKIRPIKEYTKEQIIRNLFDRVKHKVIRSAKDFRKISSVFLRAHANESELLRFLKDPDMQVEELAERTTRSGLVRDIESLTQQISIKLSQGSLMQSEVKTALVQLRELLNKGL